MHAMGQSWRAHPARPGRAWRGAVLLAALLLLSACGTTSQPNGICAYDGRTEGNRPITSYHLQAAGMTYSDGAVFMDVYSFGGMGSTFERDDSRDEIAALRASDGTLLWQRPNPFPSPLTILAGYHGMLIQGSQGYLVAMRASDGAPLWRLARGTEHYGTLALPVFDQDVLYASDFRGLYAASMRDGRVLWQLPSPAAATCPVGATCGTSSFYSRPLVAAGVVYVASATGAVVAVRASDGAVLWQTSAVPATFSAPQPEAVVGEHLYVSGTNRGVVLVRAHDGGLVGPVPHLPQPNHIDVLVIGGRLYFGLMEIDPPAQPVYSLWTQDGKALWTAPIAGGGRAIAVEDGVIYVDDGALYAIRLANGTTLWRYFGVGEIVAPAGVAPIGSGHFYLSQSGSVGLCVHYTALPVKVLALNEQDGGVAWTTPLPGIPGVPTPVPWG